MSDERYRTPTDLPSDSQFHVRQQLAAKLEIRRRGIQSGYDRIFSVADTIELCYLSSTDLPDQVRRPDMRFQYVPLYH